MSDSIFKDAARIFGKTDMSGDCWLWQGQLDKDGYGKVTVGSQRVGDKRSVRTHRWIYEYVTSEAVPSDLQLDHLCQVRNCINPAHLEPVTLEVNQSRKRKKKEMQDYCVSGRHLLALHAKETRQGKRFCGPCVAEKKHLKYLERKAAA